MKYTVFFVEDEITIREKIRESISWEGTDFIYLGDAPDGETAITRIAELQPDIVVTDIRMPHMDGLDLCRCIQQECPDTCVIILSGYSDFEYAQKAIRLNVTEYLLKPITPKNLIGALNNAAAKISVQRENRDDLKSLQNELIESRSALRESFLQGLMTGSNPADAIIKADRFGISLRSSSYSVVVVRGKVFLDTNELAQTLQDLGYVFPVFRIGYREAGMIVMARDQECLEDVLKKISTDLSNSMFSLSNPMRIEYGQIVNRISLLSNSFQNACMRIDSSPGDREMVNNSQTVDGFSPFQELNTSVLEDYLNYGLLSNLDPFLDTYLANFWQQGSDRNFSLYLIFHLKFVVKSFLEKINISADTIPHFSDYSDLHRNVGGVREQYRIILENSILARDEARSAAFGSFLAKVRSKIDEEYFDADISLETLAKYANVNPSYLSTSFKQHYKMTITQYIIEKRLKRAKELLRTTRMPIGDISASVGYHNANYFSVLFKNHAGKTAREYRNEK